jgi:hypothetical protein|tara:strand:- start:211 stop:603 length:393 start_codon:yes stop_codon:yes gene_type:complete
MVKMVKELLDYIYNKDTLRVEIDEYLDTGQTINAIKMLRFDVLTYHKSRKYTLRDIRDAVDGYKIRRNIYRKLNELKDEIEKYSRKHNYDLTDYELVEDHLDLLANSFSWKPNNTEYKEYNKLWRKYKCP